MRQLYLTLALVGGFLLYLMLSSATSFDTLATFVHDAARPVLVPMVMLIGRPAFVYVASLVIFLAAIAVCALYWTRGVRPQIRKLRALRAEIGRLPVPGPGTSDVDGALQALGRALHGAGLYTTAWASYQAQAQRDGLLPAESFASFARSDPTVDETDSRGLMHGMPSYFTSFGLILTFVGLVVALYFAARGFRSGNLDEARAAIIELLNTSSFKFLTSVAALSGALLISLVLRTSSSLFRREVAITTAFLESYLTLWRSAAPAAPARKDALGAVGDRLDLLIAAMGRLSQQIERLDGALAGRPAPATTR